MKLSVYRPLKTQKQYLKLIAANVVNRFGDSIDAIAFSWAMYRITGSASLMALIIGLNFIPTILLQPVTGALVDRIHKRKVMVLCDIGRGIVVIAVVAALLWGWATPLLLIVVTLLNSSLEALRVPAGAAFTPLILDSELYTVGTALNSTLSRVSEIAGLVLAGAVVALIGTEGALLIDAATFFLSALIIAFIRARETIEKVKIRLRDVLTGFSEGLKYIKPQKLLVAMLLTGMMMNFLMVPISVFATAYVADFLHAGAEVLSLIEVLLLVGVALGSFITPLLKQLRNKPLFIAAGIVSSLMLASFRIIPDMGDEALRYAVLVAVNIIFGFCIGIQNVIFSSSFLRIVPKEYLGRVGGLSNAILCLVMPLGSFLCSAAAAVASVPAVLLISGIFSLGLYLMLIRVKTLREL
jgi:MFS family permease